MVAESQVGPGRLTVFGYRESIPPVAARDVRSGPRGRRGLTGARGKAGKRGERGAQGLRGERGAQGERGEPGAPGTNPPLELVARMAQELEASRRDLEAAQRELRVQFTRIAQLQADLDSLRSDLKKRS